ncbi:MAG: hypothetical protein ACI9LV_000875 [Candidatus Nanohaloarchaea archaeon]|jgi:hypothetical protein
MVSSLNSRDSGKFGAMLEKMPSMDLATILVLGLNIYVLYSQLDYYNRESIFSVSFEPHILAVQASAVLIAVYVIEFLYDKKKGSGHR